MGFTLKHTTVNIEVPADVVPYAEDSESLRITVRPTRTGRDCGGGIFCRTRAQACATCQQEVDPMAVRVANSRYVRSWPAQLVGSTH